MPMKEFVVKEEAGLFDYLMSLGFNRTRVKQFLKFRAVAVNNRTIVTHDHHLHPGDRISLSFEKKPAVRYCSEIRNSNPL